MARLQILELPEGSGDDRPPFLLVLDQVDDELAEDIARWPDDIAKRIGARQVLCFPGTIDIPANDTTAYLDSDSRNEVTLKVSDQDIESIVESAERQTPQGPRPGKRVGIQPAAERTDIARDMDRLATRKHELLDALGMDHTRDWDDIRNAAAGLRKERDSWAASAQRVRDLHRPVEHRGQTICWACSDYDFPGQTTDSPPVAYDQCLTVKALTGYPAADA